MPGAWLLQDPPFGIHLCGQDYCVLRDGPVVPVHDARVRPYRGIPVFKPTTIVQHYLAPEELAPFHAQVCSCAWWGLLWQDQDDDGQSSDTAAALLWSPVQVLEHLAQREGDTPASDAPPGTSADELYSQLVQLGLLRR